MVTEPHYVPIQDYHYNIWPSTTTTTKENQKKKKILERQTTLQQQALSENLITNV